MHPSRSMSTLGSDQHLTREGTCAGHKLEIPDSVHICKIPVVLSFLDDSHLISHQCRQLDLGNEPPFYLLQAETVEFCLPPTFAVYEESISE